MCSWSGKLLGSVSDTFSLELFWDCFHDRASGMSRRCWIEPCCSIVQMRWAVCTHMNSRQKCREVGTTLTYASPQKWQMACLDVSSQLLQTGRSTICLSWTSLCLSCQEQPSFWWDPNHTWATETCAVFQPLWRPMHQPFLLRCKATSLHLKAAYIYWPLQKISATNWRGSVTFCHRSAKLVFSCQHCISGWLLLLWFFFAPPHLFTLDFLHFWISGCGAIPTIFLVFVKMTPNQFERVHEFVSWRGGKKALQFAISMTLPAGTPLSGMALTSMSHQVSWRTSSRGVFWWEVDINNHLNFGWRAKFSFWRHSEMWMLGKRWQHGESTD